MIYFRSTTIISPTFLAAANFIILGTIINRLGEQYSRLPSAHCTRFVSSSFAGLADMSTYCG
jgi:hypothetical protein